MKKSLNPDETPRRLTFGDPTGAENSETAVDVTCSEDEKNRIVLEATQKLLRNEFELYDVFGNLEN